MGPDTPPPTYAPVLYLVRFTIAVGLCAALFVSCVTPARAVQLNMDQCKELAAWAADTIWAKHVGADKERVRQWFTDRRSPVYTILLRDFDKIWGLDLKYREPLFEAVLYACEQRRGVYGDET